MAFPTAPAANSNYTNPLNGRRYIWKICPISGEGYWDHDPVFTTVSSNPFHDWDGTVTYKAGDYVFHNGYVFKAEHDNLGQDPDTATGGEWTKRGKLQWGPELNKPANAGKTVVADANGNPQWHNSEQPTTVIVDSRHGPNQGPFLQQYVMALPTNPKYFLKFDIAGVGSDKDDDNIALVMQNNGAWVDWSSFISQAHMLTTWRSSGKQLFEGDIKQSNWFDNSGGWLLNTTPTWKLGNNKAWSINGCITLTNQKTLFRIQITHESFSSNQGDSLFTTWTVEANRTTPKINLFGLKFLSGKGWFAGSLTYL